MKYRMLWFSGIGYLCVSNDPISIWRKVTYYSTGDTEWVRYDMTDAARGGVLVERWNADLEKIHTKAKPPHELPDRVPKGPRILRSERTRDP